MTTLARLFFRFRELILYGIIGGFCATLDFCIYTLLSLWTHHLLANVVSVHCGIFCSFFLNRQYNFKVKDRTAHRFQLFYIVGLSGLAVSEGLLYLLVDMAGVDHLVGKLVTVVAAALLQFLLNKYITFKKIR